MGKVPTFRDCIAIHCFGCAKGDNLLSISIFETTAYNVSTYITC